MNLLVMLGILSALAAGMSTLTAISVRWAAFARNALTVGTVQFLLTMMAGMLVGVLVYFAVPGAGGLAAGFWVASAIMSGSVVIVFLAFVREVRSRAAPGDSKGDRGARRAFVASVVGLAILNEFLMGWSFSLLSGETSTGVGHSASAVAHVISGAITSPWFVFPMALEMLLTMRWLVKVLPRALGPFLWIQPGVMICSPPTFSAWTWRVATAVGASALMAVAVALFLLALFRDVPLSRREVAYVTRLLLSLGLMSAGLFLWAVGGGPELFAVSLLAQMVVFLHISTSPDSYGGALAFHGRPLAQAT